MKGLGVEVDLRQPYNRFKLIVRQEHTKTETGWRLQSGHHPSLSIEEVLLMRHEHSSTPRPTNTCLELEHGFVIHITFADGYRDAGHSDIYARCAGNYHLSLEQVISHESLGKIHQTLIFLAVLCSRNSFFVGCQLFFAHTTVNQGKVHDEVLAFALNSVKVYLNVTVCDESPWTV